ncbi:tRNA (adenosine(37)-N6)-dimethylallyltransferase MiaA [Dyadobacter luticola]|uniref:tRNA dimethylallyltransferase n=1 Tax=Dyadobacter luticola TaxID=1979387 RepID=A0A5R9L2R5_9BACT|nr:tRNA (adenosine(37)-N6)-dimethylallyltransferase MiaA [Dyadobacter luticola]TLV02856.1 tRNA (adenosine(37)-N6)-dimethylallyltransferase MiaA [Dyadobacter luticola]
MEKEPSKLPLLIILGPTASGKTRLATKVASQIGGEIISADSRQVYRDMNIGTGKDLEEYQVEGQAIPYHLIDILNAGAQYNVNNFQHDFQKAYDLIISRGHIPIVCGGTGFYIYALLKGHAFASVPVNDSLRASLETLSSEMLLEKFGQMHTAYHEFADTSTRKRLIRAIEIAQFLTENPENELAFNTNDKNYDAIIFGLNPAVEVRRERISKRLKDRLENGLIEEVASLLTRLTKEQLIYYGLEYKYITQYLTGETSFDEMKTRLETEIHRFAKRQMTFFRKMEKDGLAIHWLPDALPEEQKITHIISAYREFKS